MLSWLESPSGFSVMYSVNVYSLYTVEIIKFQPFFYVVFYVAVKSYQTPVFSRAYRVRKILIPHFYFKTTATCVNTGVSGTFAYSMDNVIFVSCPAETFCQFLMQYFSYRTYWLQKSVRIGHLFFTSARTADQALFSGCIRSDNFHIFHACAFLLPFRC